MTGDERDFRQRRFKAPDVVDKTWLEWFREEFGRQLYNIDFDPDPEVPFRLEATARTLPDLAIAQSVRSAMRTSHYGAGGDEITMIALLEGSCAIHTGGKTHEIAAGMGAIGRQDHRSALDFPDGVRILSLRLQPRLIEAMTKDAASFAVLPDSQTLRLLRGYVRMIGNEEAIETPEARHVVTTHVHDLVALALGATRDARELIQERGVRAARLAAIKQDILAHLADPALSVAAVATRQGLTPRYVHMLFEIEGVTFSEYVLEHRLTRAHRALNDPRARHQSISAIALGVGFGDLSYFNRTFRRRFGMTPSDVRERART